MKTFYSPSGGTVFVGSNAAENEYLTFVFAQKHDLWFHVKDVPGSHVILRSDQSKSNEDLLFAAEKAAEYSKCRAVFDSGKKVSVDYCHILDVSKPKHSPIGQVEIANAKTVKVQKQKPS